MQSNNWTGNVVKHTLMIESAQLSTAFAPSSTILCHQINSALPFGISQYATCKTGVGPDSQKRQLMLPHTVAPKIANADAYVIQ